MRICFASTFPPATCGIGTYTHELAEALVGLDGVEVVILGEKGPKRELDQPKILVERAYHRREDFVSQLGEAATRHHADVVHVQHTPDLWGSDQRLPRLAEELHQRGIKCVVTLHTVYDWRSAAVERQFRAFGFYRGLGQSVDRIVVHQHRGTVDVLSRYIDPARLRVIPHGTPSIVLEDREACRERFGIVPGQPFILCVGFVHIQKNLHTVIRAATRVRREIPNLRALITGSMLHPTWFNRAYFAYLRQVAKPGSHLGGIELVERYVPEEEKIALYRAADLALFPYWEGYGSASGILHTAIATHTPMVCSTSPKFAEVVELSGAASAVSTFDVKAWSRAIRLALSNPDGLAKARLALESHARATAWSEVARQTLAMYEELLGS